MKNRWELYFLDLIRGREKGWKADCLRGMLYLLSFPYQAWMALRNKIYDQGWLQRYHPPVPLVVSVGNISAGGTGKTPFVLLLAKQFIDTHRVAILSRGYRSDAEKISSPVLLCKKEGRVHTASYCGDEPCLLVENLPHALVVVGKNRRKASNMASRAGAKLVILDDGLQHRSLARDIEIIVLQGEEPFDMGYFLPRGLLREGPAALRRADLIVINNGSSQEQQELVQKIRQYTSAPIIWVSLISMGIKKYNGDPIDSIKGKKVALFCGIARPAKFQEKIESLGAQVVSMQAMPDHVLDIKALQDFAKQCQRLGAEYLICTEKDKVKLTDCIESPLPILWLQMKMEVMEGNDQWEALLKQMRISLECRM